jgi:hypothetical protein
LGTLRHGAHISLKKKEAIMDHRRRLGAAGLLCLLAAGPWRPALAVRDSSAHLGLEVLEKSTTPPLDSSTESAISFVAEFDMKIPRTHNKSKDTTTPTTTEEVEVSAYEDEDADTDTISKTVSNAEDQMAEVEPAEDTDTISKTVSNAEDQLAEAVPSGYTMHAGMASGAGNKISDMEDTTVQQCADACDQLPNCAGFTMLDSSKCNLKSAVTLTSVSGKDTYVKEGQAPGLEDEDAADRGPAGSEDPDAISEAISDATSKAVDDNGRPLPSAVPASESTTPETEATETEAAELPPDKEEPSGETPASGALDVPEAEAGDPQLVDCDVGAEGTPAEVLGKLRDCTHALDKFARTVKDQHGRSRSANQRYVETLGQVTERLQGIRDMTELDAAFSSDQGRALKVLMAEADKVQANVESMTPAAAAAAP